MSVEGDERAENRTAGGATASTTVEDNLPAKRGKFAVNFDDTEYRQTRSESGKILHMNFKQTGSDGSLYMGEDVRQLFVEDHAEDPDMNIWLGYQTRGNNPMDEVGMEKFSWFRHISMFGTTGMGKTTSQKNLINQIVRKGYGCVVIDPKGDMAIELMQEIPESRLDDVIWVEPGSIKHPDRVAAINFLEPSIPEDHPRYDREVESIVDDLQAILKAEGYWGAKMAGITKNITRAMIRSNNPYTLYDMYNVLGQEEKRWNFARSLEREGVELGDTETGSIITDIRQYSKRIAQMEADEVDPVVSRLQDWAESPISKEIVSHRNSSVSINDAVEEGKIILVRNTVSNEEVKRVVSTAIIRRVWATIQSRADEEENEADREPFFMLIDEFDDVVSEDMNVDKMLTKARSGKMSVCLACQNPAQIEEDHEGILRQIFSNTDTMATFGVRGPDDSELIAKRMGDNVDAEDIRGMPEFRILTRITYMDEGQRKLSNAVGLQTFPDYPPLRTKEEAHEAIERSLERYGVEPMANSPEETDLLISGGGLQEQTVVDFLELVWGEQLKRGAETVTVESFADRFEEALGHPIEEFPSGIGVPPEMINVHNVSLEDDEDEDPFSMDGEWEYHEDDDTNNLIAYQTEKRIHIQKPEAEVSITAEGIDAILQQDSGRVQPTESHRKTIHDGFRWFSRLGMNLSVPIQSGTGEVCDGLADLPVEQQGAPAEIAKTLEAFEEDYPEASAISSGYHINLEAETTTQRKPARTIENVVRASTEGRKAILMVEDGRSDGHGRAYHANRVENILTDPPFYREDRMHPPGTEIPDDEEPEPEPVRILYNRTDKLRIGTPGENQEKFALIPRGKEAVWVDTGEKLKLYNGHGPDAEKWGEAKYSETHYGSSNAFKVWCRYDQYQHEWVVYPGGDPIRFNNKKELRESYQFVRGPLYMEAMIDQLPERDEWEVLILPDPKATYEDPHEATDKDQDAEKATYELDLQFPPEEVPLVYRDGEMTPLIDTDSDLLTGPRTEGDDGETDNTTEDSTADSPTEAQAMVMTSDEIQEIMDTFEQIQLEIETKRLIDSYRREYTTKELKRLDEIEDIFGAKHPGEIELWMSVWDYWSRSYDTGIAKAYLPDATMTATGLTRAKAKDAVAIAEDFELLIEATPADTDDPNVDEETTILRLVQPEERPDLFVESTADLKAFADREKWVDLWELAGDLSAEIRRGFLQTVVEKSSGFEDDKETRAAIAVGCLCGAISNEGEMYSLSDERPRDIWLTLWDKAGADLRTPLSKDELQLALRIELLDTDLSGEDYFESALEHNELYSPEDLADDQYVVNDPASDEGPAIIERDGPDPFDDPDDDPDGIDSTPPTEAETQSQSAEGQQDSQSQPDDSQEPQDADSEQENVGPATADAEPQETADAATTDDTVEGEQSVASASEGASTEPDASEQAQDQDDTESETETPDERKERSLKDEVIANPPSQERVNEAFAAAMAYFHSQIDTPIQPNIEWNDTNPNARLRKPETAREYFQHPRYDEDPTAAIRVLDQSQSPSTDTDEDEAAFGVSNDAYAELKDSLWSGEGSPLITDDLADNDALEKAAVIKPYSLQSRKTRGWSPETLETKQLGWAPVDPRKLRDHLLEEGYSLKELLATGLFFADGETVKTFFRGRYVFPYFDRDGEPAYAISRSIGTDRDGHPLDHFGNQKYTKAVKTKGYSMIDEPIYGEETVIPGEPLIITEGMADAISAHEHGIPCISPVTRQFKESHFDLLESIIVDNEIPFVYLVQDADPPVTVVREEYTEAYHESYDEATAAEADPEPQEASELGEAVSPENFGPGFDGALRTATYLDSVAIEDVDSEDIPELVIESEDGGEPTIVQGEPTPKRTFESYIIPLPRYGSSKLDLDDYLSSNYGTIVPPVMWGSESMAQTYSEHPSWIQTLLDNDELNLPKIDVIVSHQNGELNGAFDPSHETIQNVLPTISPRNSPLPPESLGEGYSPTKGTKPSGDPSKSGTKPSDNPLFNITMHDVIGEHPGFRGKNPAGHYGDSTNYFCVTGDNVAYDHKRDVGYNAITLLLCKAGIRNANDPSGDLTDREKFEMWKYAQNNNIVEAPIPNSALEWFAFSENIAEPSDLELKEVKKGDRTIQFESLPAEKYNDTLRRIEDKYGLDHGKKYIGNPDNQADNSADPSGAENVGGVGFDVVTGDDSAGGSTGDREVDGDGDTDEEDERTRFLTYEEPDLDNPAIDVDTDAVHQFVSEFAVVHEGDDPSIGIKKDTLLLAFANWSKMNNVELNELSEDKATQPKKTKLKTILNSLFNIEADRVNKDGDRFRGFRSIELSDLGEELLDSRIE